MKTETFAGDIKRAYGKDLPTTLHFEGSFQAYENKAEVVAAKDELSDDEYTEARNLKRKAEARAKAWTKCLDDANISKPDRNDPEVIREGQIKSIMSQHKLDYETSVKVLDSMNATAEAFKAAAAAKAVSA